MFTNGDLKWSDLDFEEFGKMLGIDFEDTKSKRPNPNQKAIDEIDKILKRYGGWYEFLRDNLVDFANKRSPVINFKELRARAFAEIRKFI